MSNTSKSRLCVSISAGLSAALLYHFVSAGPAPPSAPWRLLRGADWYYGDTTSGNCDGQAIMWLNMFHPGSVYYPPSGCASPNVGAPCGFCDGGATFLLAASAGIGWPNGEMPGTSPNCGDLMEGDCGVVGPLVPPTYGWGCANVKASKNRSGQINMCGQAPGAIIWQATHEPVLTPVAGPQPPQPPTFPPVGP